MNIIFASLCLAFISRADCSERIFEGCKGSPEIYLQWYPPISGWYKRNLSRKNNYSRIPPNVTALEKFDFFLEKEEWYLNQFTKELSKSIELKIKDDHMISSLPRISNIYPSRSKRSGKRQGLRSNLHSNKIKAKTSEKPITVIKTKREKNQDMKYQTMAADDPSKFNVYCPGRCRCIKAVVETTTITQFVRFDVADSNTTKTCWEKIENATELPEENKVVHRLKKGIQPTTDNTEPNEINYDEPFMKINQWKPELYVSEKCEVLYYNKLYDTWIADFDWEERGCNTYHNGAGIDNYISNNSAPCLEYLPDVSEQQWSNPQPYNPGSGSSEDQFLPDDLIEYCKMNFTLKLNPNFKMSKYSLQYYSKNRGNTKPLRLQQFCQEYFVTTHILPPRKKTYVLV